MWLSMNVGEWVVKRYSSINFKKIFFPVFKITDLLSSDPSLLFLPVYPFPSSQWQSCRSANQRRASPLWRTDPYPWTARWSPRLVQTRILQFSGMSTDHWTQTASSSWRPPTTLCLNMALMRRKKGWGEGCSLRGHCLGDSSVSQSREPKSAIVAAITATWKSGYSILTMPGISWPRKFLVEQKSQSSCQVTGL